MDSKKIDELLNRYWECETTLEEEQQLRDYFLGNHLPEHHKEAAALFRYFSESKKKSIQDSGFETRVLSETKPKRGKAVNLFYNSMRIAAGIAVLMVATWFIRTELRKSTPQEVVDTFDDPQLAFEETKKALRIISQGIGKAEVHTQKINLFNEAQEEIQKADSNKSQL